LTSSLPVCVTFIFSSCFIALARNSKSMLNRHRESGDPFFVPYFPVTGFIFFQLNMIFAIGL
jgi:hypothetical protein